MPYVGVRGESGPEGNALRTPGGYGKLSAMDVQRRRVKGPSLGCRLMRVGRRGKGRIGSFGDGVGETMSGRVAPGRKKPRRERMFSIQV